MRIAYDARPLIEPTTGIGRYVRCLLEAIVDCQEVQEILLCSHVCHSATSACSVNQESALARTLRAASILSIMHDVANRQEACNSLEAHGGVQFREGAVLFDRVLQKMELVAVTRQDGGR